MALHSPDPESPERILVFGGPGQGKAQPLNAKVLTPTGWTTMGAISPGDKVIGSSGMPTRVRAVHPQGVVDIYRVTMSDGATTRCCGDHLWETHDNHHQRSRVSTTRELQQSVLDGKARYLPITEPIRFSPKDALPLHPYLLGLLLGDGGMSQDTVAPSFTTADPELVESISHLLPAGVTVKPRTNQYSYGLSGDRGNEANSLTLILRSLGLMPSKSPEKFVPEMFLFDTIENRWALLQGLLDTDGGLEDGRVMFSTSSPQLAEDVINLVRSLGGITRLFSKIPSFAHLGEQRQGLRCYRLTITLPKALGAPFRLQREVKGWQSAQAVIRKEPNRRVVEVAFDGSEEAQCITVDASDGLYITDDFLLTHNSYDAYCVARLAARTRSDAKFFIIDTDRSVARMVSDPAFRPYLVDEHGTRTNIVSQDVDDWDSLMDAMKKFQEDARRQDWIILDMISPAWEWAQAHFSKRVFGHDLEEHMMQMRLEAQAKPNDKDVKSRRGGFDGRRDWGTINSLYSTLTHIIIRSSCNLYATAAVKTLSSEQADEETKGIYGAFGVTPVGQKHLGHSFQTLIWKRSFTRGEYMATTVKDRARQDMEGMRINDFAVDYLCKIAGWQLGS
jgi:hypothetical protein